MRPLPAFRTLFRIILLCAIPCLASVHRAQDTRDRFARPIVVPTHTDNYPYSFLGASGRPEGFTVELLDAVAQIMEIPLERPLLPAQNLKDGLISGQYDLLQVYSFDPTRESFAAFSTSYLNLQGSFFVNLHNTALRSHDDLAGREIVIVGPGSPVDQYLRRHLPSARIAYAGGAQEALHDLEAGRHEVVFLTRMTGLSVIDHYGLKNVVPLGPPLAGCDVRFCFAVRRDDTELLTRLNEGLAILHRTGRFERLYEKWFGRLEPQKFSRQQAALIALPFLLLALVGSLWAWWHQRQLRTRLSGKSAELAESRALLAEAQAFAHLGHWRRVLGPPDHVTWSEEAYRIHERDPHLGPPPTIADLVSCAVPADALRWQASVERAIRDDHSYELDLTIEPRPGRRKFIHVRGRSQVDPSGRIVAVFGTVQDITARRAAEIARQESEQLLRALYDNLPNALGVLDRTAAGWELVSLNPEAVRLTGLAERSTIGGPEAASLVKESWWRELLARAESATRPVRFQFQREDVHREFAATLVPLRSPDGNPRCCFLIEDITERNVRDAEIAQGRRLRAIGEMVGGIAHEFNNLLTPILVTADALASDPRVDPAHQPEHKLIADTARRAAGLTRRLLTFERKADRKPEIVNLHTIVEANLDLLRHTADRRIRLSNTLGAGLPALHLDTGDLNQIVLNLLLNARDTLDEKLAQTPPAGWTPAIVLSATTLPASAAVPHDATAQPLPGRWLRLAVNDNGLGMSGAVIERIFEPFYSTKQVGRGTGLGLATVWHLVSDLGGRIEVQSLEGAGTTFFVFLPVRPTTLTVGPVPSEPGRPAGGLRLLVAEDEELIANILRTLLTREHHEVTLASNGREAWEIFERRPTDFDALLFDINMPEMTGIELTSRVRASGYRGPILIMSGRITDDARRDLDTLGVDAIVNKPFTLDSLRAALAHAGKPSG
jgi:two-component system, cell cycle sensor histidine kinase and response regulator CckA